MKHQHRRERLRSFRRRASAHFHRRSFLKDAPIILLDEATASLDVENETAIQEALSRLIKNKTVLIIAHWMRTVASADQVVVLSGGIVVEQGSPAELYARKGLYTHMGDRKNSFTRRRIFFWTFTAETGMKNWSRWYSFPAEPGRQWSRRPAGRVLYETAALGVRRNDPLIAYGTA